MGDIAVIGVSFKLPQDAKDEATFWGILQHGKNLMTEWPEARARIDAFYDPVSGRRNKVGAKILLRRYTISILFSN